jgi:hypothetical protein
VYLGRYPMRRTTDNPDRNFSADPHKSDAAALRSLLQRSEPADLLDRVVRERIGRVIAWAVSDSRKPQ